MKEKSSKPWVVAVLAFILAVGAAAVAGDPTNRLEQLKNERLEELRKKREGDFGLLPAGVPRESWIALGEKAGYAITREVSASVVDAAFYLKTESGWRQARVQSPALPEFLRQ